MNKKAEYKPNTFQTQDTAQTVNSFLTTLEKANTSIVDFTIFFKPGSFIECYKVTEKRLLSESLCVSFSV